MEMEAHLVTLTVVNAEHTALYTALTRSSKASGLVRSSSGITNTVIRFRPLHRVLKPHGNGISIQRLIKEL
jgi:hypothetical protein